MKKVLAITISILIVGGIGWLATSNRNTPSEPTSQTELEKAPDFALQNYDGKTVRPADFSGKPLIINSWAAWCPFCRKELVDFATVQKEFGDKVIFIAVDRAESLDVAKRYTDELGVTENMVFLLDPSDSFYQSIGGFSMPETIFVDSNSNIVFHKRGPMDTEEIRMRVKELFQL